MSTTTGLRERKKQGTRRAVQRAALELFAAHGYRETTLAQIAEAAEVSLRTVTVHFPAKDDLVLALGFEGIDGLVERIESRPAGEQALDALRAWIARQITQSSAAGVSDESHELLRLRHQVVESDPELQARVRGADLRIERTLTAAIAQDLGLPADALAPRLAAATVVIGMRTITEPVLRGEDEQPRSGDKTLALVDRTLTFARAGLCALAQPCEPPA
jgi:AcrR family transcriptional regulator